MANVYTGPYTVFKVNNISFNVDGESKVKIQFQGSNIEEVKKFSNTAFSKITAKANEGFIVASLSFSGSDYTVFREMQTEMKGVSVFCQTPEGTTYEGSDMIIMGDPVQLTEDAQEISFVGNVYEVQ